MGYGYIAQNLDCESILAEMDIGWFCPPPPPPGSIPEMGGHFSVQGENVQRAVQNTHWSSLLSGNLNLQVIYIKFGTPCPGPTLEYISVLQARSYV